MKPLRLQDFLVEAKKRTYASAGESGEKKLADGTRELSYENGDWKYRDRYFGFRAFVGEEIVWEKKKPVWGMNYYGRILSDSVDAEALYRFLKKALILIAPERTFRGPESFCKQEWEYMDRSKGTVEAFSGVEEIYFQGKKVYELLYHGGTVSRV